MKKPEDCTIEELISNLVYWESDMNSSLVIHSEEDGSVNICRLEYATIYGQGKTLKEALIDFGYKEHIESINYYTIDWSK